MISVSIPLGDVPAPNSVGLRQDGTDVEVTWTVVDVANVLEYCLERTTVSDSTVVSLGCYSSMERYYRDSSVPTTNSGQTVAYQYSVWARVWMFASYKDGTKASSNISYVGEAPDLPAAAVRNFRYYAGTDYVTLKWEASDKDEGVVGYNIKRNDWSEAVTVTGRLTTSYQDNNVSIGTYTYTITALDDANKDGAAPFREGVSNSLSVNFVGSSIIKEFLITPETQSCPRV